MWNLLSDGIQVIIGILLVLSFTKTEKPGIARLFCLFINIYSVSKCDNIHYQFVVKNIIDYAVIAYSDAVTISAPVLSDMFIKR